MRHSFLTAAAVLLASLTTSSAFAQPVSGECAGPECPLWIEGVNAAVDAAATGPCAEAPDPELERKVRAGTRLTPAEFVRFVTPHAQQSERETGVPASVTIAQAALETGWGRTARAAANNLFGIKGRGNNGSVKLWTREYLRGRWVRVRANFAAYKTFGDSVAAHGRLISENAVYARAMAVRDEGPEAFARALQRCGYATDPKYAQKLMQIINSRDLAKYDGSRECPA